MSYFTDKEMSCKCGRCDAKMDSEFMVDLVSLRTHCAFPFIITSAVRCEQHNEKIGGYHGSYHLKGRAVDIKVSGDRAHKLLSLLRRYGFMGVGVSQKGDFNGRFIHIDNRPSPAVWSY